MLGCPVVALWGVPCSGQSPGEGGVQKPPGLLGPLPIKDSDAVFEYVVYLCAEYERIAFATGLKLGTQLMMELAGETSVDQ